MQEKEHSENSDKWTIGRRERTAAIATGRKRDPEETGAAEENKRRLKKEGMKNRALYMVKYLMTEHVMGE